MAEIKLTYDSRNKIAKNALRFILSLGVFKEVPLKTPIELSLEEAKNGKVNTYETVDAFFEKMSK
ncbi:MAG: hypothetical protein CFE24_14010 [Flavobacterium sp. BFFFF2]|nr:MAG: hypothetical protein CFE24_14010 [Flavobacterium sp. BFFFF2]